jgi:hypothetical protein
VLKAESLTLKAVLPAKSTTVSLDFWVDDKPSTCKIFFAGFGEIFMLLLLIQWRIFVMIICFLLTSLF